MGNSLAAYPPTLSNIVWRDGEGRGISPSALRLGWGNLGRSRKPLPKWFVPLDGSSPKGKIRRFRPSRSPEICYQNVARCLLTPPNPSPRTRYECSGASWTTIKRHPEGSREGPNQALARRRPTPLHLGLVPIPRSRDGRRRLLQRASNRGGTGLLPVSSGESPAQNQNKCAPMQAELMASGRSFETCAAHSQG
jgi:hypothetical protein